MVELHAGELLLSCLPVRCQQAARIGAHLHELQGLFDVGLGRKHRPLRRDQVEQLRRHRLRVVPRPQVSEIGIQLTAAT